MKRNKLQQLLRDNTLPRDQAPVSLVRAEGSSEATLYLYDVIDPYWGIAAEGLVKEIQALDPTVTLNVRINSPGGDVFEGRAIANAIRAFKGKTVGWVDGLAASAATTVAEACDEVVMGQGSFFMIHNAWAVVWGNKADMADMQSLLDKIDLQIAADYARRTGKDMAAIAAWMDAETWFNADEAVAEGFADRVHDVQQASNSAHPRVGASWNLSAYDKAPKALTEKPPRAEPDQAAVLAANQRRLRLLELT